MANEDDGPGGRDRQRWRLIVSGSGQAIGEFDMTKKQRAREIAEIQRLLDEVTAAARKQAAEMVGQGWRGGVPPQSLEPLEAIEGGDDGAHQSHESILAPL
jgi:hypothetical protein